MRLTAPTVIMALVYLGLEPVEDEGKNRKTLDKTLSGYGLTVENLLTEAACFSIGYHRGLQSLAFSDDQVPVDDEGKTIPELLRALEEGYVIALEARDLKLVPPPSLAYQGWKNGDIEPSAVAKWADTLDLSDSHRLAVAVNVGSGKSQVTVPAGTPVDVLSEIEKDGVKHYIVDYDGSALIIPSPDDGPDVIVSASTAVEPVRKRRASKKGDGTKKSKSSAERGPSLKDAIVWVAEGKDGGNGPLQSNGEFAARVRARCQELGIGDKAQTFIMKADRHVPYYLNGYKPVTEKESDEIKEAGRTGVERPLAWVCAAIEGRKYYLKAEGDHETKLSAIPKEILDRMADTEAVIEIPKAAAA